MEIEKQLLNSQIEQEKIINLSKIMQSIKERQYFDLPQLCSEKVREEVFVDCGCYDAFNSLQFIMWCNGNYKKITFVLAIPGAVCYNRRKQNP